MFARKFFFVCAGLLCLAITYHFGASSAKAAKPGPPIIAAYANYPITVACIDRTVYMRDVYNPQGLRTFPSVPGTEPVIAVGYNTTFYGITAMLSNGDTYMQTLNGYGTWELTGNAIGAP
jgi:hypothetical protein